MAKRSNEGFQFERLSEDEYEVRRRSTGSGRGRRSKYTPVGVEAEKLENDQVLVFKASKNEVQSIRNYFRRNYDADFQVSASSAGEDQFEVSVRRK
ncbi:hypothetical protein BH23BAC4_BH23BAC4_08060 [soil metagenome]|jgi:hypothetical protein